MGEERRHVCRRELARGAELRRNRYVICFTVAVCAKEKAAGKSEDAWTAKLVLLCVGVR